MSRCSSGNIGKIGDANVDDFVVADEAKIKWSLGLKQKLKRGQSAQNFQIQKSENRFTVRLRSRTYTFDRIMNEAVYVFPSIFPTPETESGESCDLCRRLRSKGICCFDEQIYSRFELLWLTHNNPSPSIPTTRTEGTAVRASPIGRWHNSGRITETTPSASGTSFIMSTVCSITRHIGSGIRRTSSGTCHACRMRRDFWEFAKAGRRLGEIHLGYEDVEGYPLRFVETPGIPLDWRVEKMKLSRDKTGIKYNDFLTLDGIPAKAFEYRLGNRSALEWVIDQYRVKTDKRSGIVNDPNDPE